MSRSSMLALGLSLTGITVLSIGCINLGQALSLVSAAGQAQQVAAQNGLDTDAAQAAAVFFTIKTNQMTGQEVANEVNAVSADKISSQEGDLVVSVAYLPGMDNYSINHCLRDRLRAVNINLYGGYSSVAPATVAMDSTGATVLNTVTGTTVPQPASCSGLVTPTFTQAQVSAVARATKWAKLINIGQ